MAKLSTFPIVKFSVRHPWIIIGISLIITIALTLPLKKLQNSCRELQLVLPVKEIIDPFSFTTLLKSGSRLSAAPMAPGGAAP